MQPAARNRQKPPILAFSKLFSRGWQSHPAEVVTALRTTRILLAVQVSDRLQFRMQVYGAQHLMQIWMQVYGAQGIRSTYEIHVYCRSRSVLPEIFC